MLIDPVTEERDPTPCPAKDPVPPTPPDRVADRVTDDRPRDGGKDHRGKRNAPLGREHAPEHHRDLTREHEAEESGRFECGNEEDDREGDPAAERQDPVGDTGNHLIPFVARGRSALPENVIMLKVGGRHP